MIISPCYGEVKEVLINKGAYVHDWEQLFLIQVEGGKMGTVSMGIRGWVETLKVQKGDKVIPGMVLVCIKEDVSVPATE
jgi:acetyl/propionyl-CoA carboxylase alpha subunit